MRIVFPFITILLLFASSFCTGQNSPVFSNFMFLKPLYNPASVGSNDAMEVFAVYREQWVGIKDNPSVQALSFSSPLTVINSSMGIFAVNEMQGAERVTSVLLSFAYKHNFKRVSLSAGVSGGIMHRAIYGDKLRAPEGDYSNGIRHFYDPSNPDPVIPTGSASGITGDLNAGIWFQMKNLYAGISANNIMENGTTLEWEEQSTKIKNPRYFTLSAGYSFKIGKKLSLLPNVIVKSDFINTQPEFNAILQYKNNIYGGLSFRGFTSDLTDALVVMAGFKLLKRLTIGYSYDFSLSSLNLANSGSHEVFIHYEMNIKELLSPGKIIYNPRFL